MLAPNELIERMVEYIPFTASAMSPTVVIDEVTGIAVGGNSLRYDFAQDVNPITAVNKMQIFFNFFIFIIIRSQDLNQV